MLLLAWFTLIHFLSNVFMDCHAVVLSRCLGIDFPVIYLALDVFSVYYLLAKRNVMIILRHWCRTRLVLRVVVTCSEDSFSDLVYWQCQLHMDQIGCHPVVWCLACQTLIKTGYWLALLSGEATGCISLGCICPTFSNWLAKAGTWGVVIPQVLSASLLERAG